MVWYVAVLLGIIRRGYSKYNILISSAVLYNMAAPGHLHKCSDTKTSVAMFKEYICSAKKIDKPVLSLKEMLKTLMKDCGLCMIKGVVLLGIQ